MKTIALFILTILTVSFSSYSQSDTLQKMIKNEPKQLVALVNTASWCPVCRANGPRVKENVFANYMHNEKVQILVNDLSTEESKAKSKEKYTAAGISKIASTLSATGMIYFIDPITQKVISEISVVKTNEEIINAFEKVISQ